MKEIIKAESHLNPCLVRKGLYVLQDETKEDERGRRSKNNSLSAQSKKLFIANLILELCCSGEQKSVLN